MSGDLQTGVRIIKKSLEEPLRVIAENAGQEGAVIVDAVHNQKDSYGYDAHEGEFGDMLERGIVDPAKVTRTALENASSIAALVLTTESLVTEIPEETPPMPRAARPVCLNTKNTVRHKQEEGRHVATLPLACAYSP